MAFGTINFAPIQGPSQDILERQRLLAELFRDHSRRLRRVFVRRGHGADDALDLVQEVFVRLARCDLALLQARPGSMVFRVARFVSVDARRRQQTQVRIGLGVWDSLADVEVDDGQPSPEQRMIWRQAIQSAVAAIRSLPPKGGQAYWLYRVGECSQREIANIQGVSMKTVEKHIAASAARFRAMAADDARMAA
jgi:RNA polymerase sigma-70 factor (ECF subfamily)